MATILRVPPRFAGAEMRHVDHEIFDCVHAYAAHMGARVREGKGLLLSGPPGVGKSYAMAALTRAYLFRARSPDHVFETSYTLVEKYATYNATDSSRDDRAWSTVYETTPWLVINDLGKEMHAGKVGEQNIYRIGRLLRTRSERMLVTHITTNLVLEGSGSNSFLQVFGDSTFSLVCEMFELWGCDGPDRRVTPGG